MDAVWRTDLKGTGWEGEELQLRQEMMVAGKLVPGVKGKKVGGLEIHLQGVGRDLVQMWHNR